MLRGLQHNKSGEEGMGNTSSRATQWKHDSGICVHHTRGCSCLILLTLGNTVYVTGFEIARLPRTIINI